MADFELIAVGKLQQPQRLIVLLHGMGDNNLVLSGVAEEFARAIPDALIMIPNAP